MHELFPLVILVPVEDLVHLIRHGRLDHIIVSQPIQRLSRLFLPDRRAGAVARVAEWDGEGRADESSGSTTPTPASASMASVAAASLALAAWRTLRSRDRRKRGLLRRRRDS